MDNESSIKELKYLSMRNYYQEAEDLLMAGRSMPENEFDNYLDSYFENRLDSEKEKIGEEILKIKLSRLEQIKKIDNEMSFLTQLDGKPAKYIFAS